MFQLRKDAVLGEWSDDYTRYTQAGQLGIKCETNPRWSMHWVVLSRTEADKIYREVGGYISRFSDIVNEYNSGDTIAMTYQVIGSGTAANRKRLGFGKQAPIRLHGYAAWGDKAFTFVEPAIVALLDQKAARHVPEINWGVLPHGIVAEQMNAKGRFGMQRYMHDPRAIYYNLAKEFMCAATLRDFLLPLIRGGRYVGYVNPIAKKETDPYYFKFPISVLENDEEDRLIATYNRDNHTWKIHEHQKTIQKLYDELDGAVTVMSVISDE